MVPFWIPIISSQKAFPRKGTPNLRKSPYDPKYRGYACPNALGLSPEGAALRSLQPMSGS